MICNPVSGANAGCASAGAAAHLLLAVIALICAFVWFDRVGLPDFLKRRLVETLRDQGVELEFSRLRFSLVRGLIAENVRVGHLGAAPDSPALSVEQSGWN